MINIIIYFMISVMIFQENIITIYILVNAKNAGVGEEGGRVGWK